MTPVEAVILALVQGVTEFLPISSSAHLILLPYVLGWEEHGLRFDVVTNAGTLLAAILFFRKDLRRAARRAHVGVRRRGLLRAVGRKPGLGAAVGLASIPTLVVAFLFYGWISTDARSPLLIAVTSIGFGLLLWWADHRGRRVRNLRDLRWRDALAIGISQAFALVPGTSRSGVTITAGLFLGFTREEAARFSFMMAIPIGVLAFARDLVDLLTHGNGGESAPVLAIGFVVSAISAYLVIGWLLHWLERRTLSFFVVYRVALGLLILALVAWR